MTELLKHYVPALGAFFVEAAADVVIGGKTTNHFNTQKVCRDEIVALFEDKLRVH